MNWDYIAGLFDGEGSVYLNPKGSHGTRPTVGIQISNTYRDVLEEVRHFCGHGQVSCAERPGPQRRCKIPCYAFQTRSHRNVLTFAEHIIPQSIIKRRKLEELVAFIQGQRWGKTPNPRSSLWDADPKHIRELYWNQGLRLREIGRRYDTTQGVTSHYMKRKGIPTRPSGPVPSVATPSPRYGQRCTQVSP